MGELVARSDAGAEDLGLDLDPADHADRRRRLGEPDLLVEVEAVAVLD